MAEVALIIIYNHRYDKNIDILNSIYKNRFTHIYHLVPFYTGDKPNVIAVYDNSYYFQGYIAQGFKSFFQDRFDHYFFVADDMVLNPVINEINYAEYLKLNKNTCFLPEFIELHKNGYWQRIKQAYKYNINEQGVEAAKEIPDYSNALKQFNKFGLEIKPLKFSQIWKIPKSVYDLKKMIYRDPFLPFRFLYHKLTNKKYNLPYPIVGSYADIFVISADTIKQFSHYCGVFATTKLFVEVGLPTALVLSAKEIVTEKNLNLQGQPLWTKDDFSILDKYNNQLDLLLNNFPENHLYLHPIKLSKWKI